MAWSVWGLYYRQRGYRVNDKAMVRHEPVVDLKKA